MISEWILRDTYEWLINCILKILTLYYQNFIFDLNTFHCSLSKINLCTFRQFFWNFFFASLCILVLIFFITSLFFLFLKPLIFANNKNISFHSIIRKEIPGLFYKCYEICSLSNSQWNILWKNHESWENVMQNCSKYFWSIAWRNHCTDSLTKVPEY